METKLSVVVMQNPLATCWFYIIIICGYAKPTCNMLVLYNNHIWCWNKNIFLFFILSIIRYIIDVFSFSFIFSPLKGRYLHRNKMVCWFITVMNLQTVLYLSSSQVLLGG